MNHQDHVNLLRGAINGRGGRWADLGSGDGAFTLALADLIGAESEIYSIDKDRGRLAEQEKRFRRQFPDTRIHFINGDFMRPQELPELDGIVMANSLHFVRNKLPLLNQLRGYLKIEGRLILVEYNADTGNPWVPHPLSFDSFRELAPRAGFTTPQLLATVPSRFLQEIYSALARREAGGVG